MPGVEISLAALTSRGAKLPTIDLLPPKAVIGKSTVDAIRSGVVYGFAGAIDGILRRLLDELGEETDVIATGGLAGAIVPFTELIDEVDDLLTLTGLRLLHERNTLSCHTCYERRSSDGRSRLLSSRVARSAELRRPGSEIRRFLSPREHMPKDVILTADGLEKLKVELAHLQGDKRREVAQRIKEAREFGDITENSEYDDAKNEQAMLEARIAQVEERLRSATVIAAEDVKTDVVQVGSIVSVKDAGHRQGAEVHDRRIARGQAARAAVLRVAGGQGAARPQAQRHRRRRAAERPQDPAEDHEDRRRAVTIVDASVDACVTDATFGLAVALVDCPMPAFCTRSLIYFAGGAERMDSRVVRCPRKAQSGPRMNRG